MTNNTKIEINGVCHEKSFLIKTIAGQHTLMNAKDAPSRPRCVCSANRPEMYISRRGGHFYLSRMPGSGNEHDEGCQSHLTEAFTNTELEADQILKALWEEVLHTGVLNNSWPALQAAIQQAAVCISVDGERLSNHLLVPDPFSKDTLDSSIALYARFYQRQIADKNKQIRYWTVGFLKDIVERKYNYQATIKHMSSTRFWVHKDLFEIFPEMPLAEGKRVICLFSCRHKPSGIEVDEAACLQIDSVSPIVSNLPMPLPPTDAQIQQVRIALDLPSNADREVVFGALVEKFLALSN